MNLRLNKQWIFRVAFVLIWSLGIFFWGRNTAKECDLTGVVPQVDTLIIRDTITQEMPVYSIKTNTITEYIQVTDTIRINDTLFVPVPIEKKVYEDSLYRAEISGYKANLDRIDIYQRKQVVTQTATIFVAERKRWGIGLQAGYGATPVDGTIRLAPYIGIGLSYDLIRW
jgi:hypothetical protein